MDDRNHVFVLLATVLGLVAGVAADPLGQRLADASFVADERRRQEAMNARQTAPAAPTGDRVATGDALQPEGPADDGVQIGHLLPQGRSPGRSALAGVLSGVLAGLAAARFGCHLLVVPYLVFLVALVMLSLTDLSHRLLPRTIIYPTLVVVAALLVANSLIDGSRSALTGAAIGGVASFAVFFAVWYFVPRGMGFGDVRLAGLIGMAVGYLSLLHVYVAFVVALLAGLLVSVVVLVVAGGGRKTRIPFGPSLAIGASVAVLWGGPLVHAIFPATR